MKKERIREREKNFALRFDTWWRKEHPLESAERTHEVGRRRLARHRKALGKAAPKEIVEIYSLISQIKRELRK